MDSRSYKAADKQQWQPRFQVAREQVNVPVSAMPAESIALRLALALCLLLTLSLGGLYLGNQFPPSYTSQARVMAIIPGESGEASGEVSSVLTRTANALLAPEKLQEAADKFNLDTLPQIAAEQEGLSPVLMVSAQASSPLMSVRLANYFADQLADESGARDALIAERETLAEAVSDAQAELRAFEAEQIANPPGDTQSEEMQLTTLKREVEIARQSASEIEALNLETVMVQGFPEELSTPALEEMTQRLALTEAEYSEARERYGPKHPHLLSLKSTLDAARLSLSSEIKRLSKVARSRLQKLAAEELALEERLAAGGGEAVDAKSNHTSLQDKLVAARTSLSRFDAEHGGGPIARFRLVTPASAIGIIENDGGRYFPLYGFFLGIAAAIATILLVGSRGKSEPARAGASVGNVAPRAIPVPAPRRSVAEQIGILEEAWPRTGRHDAMPEPANDESYQAYEPEVRALAQRLSELRIRARAASDTGSVGALDMALKDIQRLRNRVNQLESARRARSGK